MTNRNGAISRKLIKQEYRTIHTLALQFRIRAFLIVYSPTVRITDSAMWH